MKPIKIMKLGLIGTGVLGSLAFVATQVSFKAISSQQLVMVGGTILFTGLGWCVAKLREQTKR